MAVSSADLSSLKVTKLTCYFQASGERSSWRLQVWVNMNIITATQISQM